MDSISEIRDVSGLTEYLSVWRTLLAVTPGASYFQSADWLAVRWRHASHDEELFVVVATGDDGQPTGFIPLCIKHEKTACGTMRVLRFPLDGWGSFYGPISIDPEAALYSALRYMRQSNHKFDLVDLNNILIAPISSEVSAGSPIVNPSVVTFAGQPCHDSACIAMLDLNSDWDGYWGSRHWHKGRRRNIERCERRLSELGTVRYERYRPAGINASNASPRWDLYDACESIARLSWQNGLVNGNTMHHSQVRPFLRDAHVAAVNAGAVDMNVLSIDERPIAFTYGYHFQGRVEVMRIGFVPEFAKFAPGNALWTRLIKDSFQRGDRLLDLGPSCLDYKSFWLTRIVACYRLVQYRSSARVQALRLARWVKTTRALPVDDSNQHSKLLAAAHQCARTSSEPELINA